MFRVKNPESEIRPRLQQLVVWVVLISIVMLPRLLNLDTFIGPDEKAIWGWGNKFALTLSQGNWQDMLIGDGYPAVTLMWANTIGVASKWLLLRLGGTGLPFEEVIGLDRPLELYAERRLILSLLNGLQILAAYPLLRTVWDEYVAALSVGLMAIEPLYLAFGRMIRADALLAGFMLLSILSTLVFLKTDDRRFNWLAGVMGGLAALSKFSGGITALIAVTIYALVFWSRGRHVRPSHRRPEDRSGIRWLAAAVLGWGIPAAIVFFGLWPAWWFRPADTFNLLWGKMVYHAVEATSQRASTHFWGKMHPLGPGPWFYPVLALLRLTPWLLLGSFVAVGHQLWRAIRLRLDAVDWYALAMCFYVAAYWLAITVPGQKIDRYFVPVVPGLAVLTSIEVVGIGRWVMRRLPQRVAGSLLPTGVVIGFGLLTVAHVVAYHPVYSTYFNPLIANSALVQWALPVGQGEGVDVALKYLSTLPGAGESTVVCGTNFPRCRPFFDGEVWNQEDLRSSRWFGADYALLHIDERQVGEYPDGVLAYLRREPEIFVAEYHGIEYTWLYVVPQPSYLTGGSKLEGMATLFGYDVEERSLSALSPGDRLRLHLYWQNEGQAAKQRFWWRVVDSEGYVWNEAVAQPSPEFEGVAPQEDAIVEGEVLLSLPPDMPPGVYYLKAGFADAKGDLGQFALPAEGSTLEVTGPTATALPSAAPSQPGKTLESLLTPDMRLRGYDLSSMEGVPGEASWVTLHWQVNERPQHDYVISLSLLNEAQEQVASWSGRPFHNNYPTLQWPANANVRDPWRVLLPEDLSPGPYQLRLSLLDASSLDELAQTELGMFNVVARRKSFDIPPMRFQAGEAFDDIVTLLGYDLLGDLLPDGAHMQVMLYWQALQVTDQLYTVSLRLVDKNGLVLAEQMSQPAAGTVLTTEWQPGEIVADLHEIDIASSEPIAADLEVRLLNTDGDSVPLSNGAPLDNGGDAIIVSDVHEKVMWRIPSP